MHSDFLIASTHDAMLNLLTATWIAKNQNVHERIADIDSTKLEVQISPDRRNELCKRWGTARFLKQIVCDDKKLKKLLQIKVDIDGSQKLIKSMPYIHMFLARCRVSEERLMQKAIAGVLVTWDVMLLS